MAGHRNENRCVVPILHECMETSFLPKNDEPQIAFCVPPPDRVDKKTKQMNCRQLVDRAAKMVRVLKNNDCIIASPKRHGEAFAQPFFAVTRAKPSLSGTTATLRGRMDRGQEDVFVPVGSRTPGLPASTRIRRGRPAMGQSRHCGQRRHSGARKRQQNRVYETLSAARVALSQPLSSPRLSLSLTKM